MDSSSSSASDNSRVAAKRTADKGGKGSSARRAPPPPPPPQDKSKSDEEDPTSSSSASSASSESETSSSSSSATTGSETSGTPLKPQKSTAVFPGAQPHEDHIQGISSVETERLGLRLGQEVLHLKERVNYWRSQYDSACDGWSRIKAQYAELELHATTLERDLEATRRENAELRLKISADAAASVGAQAESGRIASAREDALLALVSHAESEATRLRSICEDKMVEIAKLETSHDCARQELRDAMILAESKYRKRVERMRERTLQHVAMIHNLKAALAESASQSSQAQALHLECANRLEAAKIRIEALEGEISLSETQNKKNHASLLETRSIMSELRAQVLEKDRQLDRDSVVIAQLQIQVQDIKAASSELEREVRNVKEEKEHSRALMDAELLRAMESASRARELQRHAERDLLAAKHRVEEAITEASERLAETQRVHNKEVAALKSEIEELKNALAAERMTVNNVAEQASLKSSRDLAEARNASAQFIFRLESQLASAVGKAERFERLYQQQLSASKDAMALEVKFASATSERNELLEKLRKADENLRQFEIRALSAEGEVEMLRRRLETAEADLHRVVLVGAGSEDRRDSEHRSLVRAMDQLTSKNAHLEKNIDQYRSDLSRLRGKYRAVKDCNADLMRTIRDYEKLCLR